MWFNQYNNVGKMEKKEVCSKLIMRNLKSFLDITTYKLKPSPGLSVGYSVPFFKITAPFAGSSIKSRCPSRSA